MYPLLKALMKEGLVKVPGSKGKGESKTYTLTSKGNRELEETRRLIAGAGRKEPVMARLFAELLPGNVFVPMVVRRLQDGGEVLRQKMAEIPTGERELLLRELRLLMASQIDWIDSQLSSAPPAQTKLKRQV